MDRYYIIIIHMNWSNSLAEQLDRSNPFLKPNPFSLNSSASSRVQKDPAHSIIDHKIESLNSRNPFNFTNTNISKNKGRPSINGGTQYKVNMFPKFDEHNAIIK